MFQNSKNDKAIVTKKSKLIIVTSICLCIVLGTTIGLTTAFRQKVAPNFGNATNVQLSQRAQAYQGIKLELQQKMSTRTVIPNATEQEQLVIQQGNQVFYQEFSKLLDANVEYNELFQFIDDFVNNLQNVDLFNAYNSIFYKNQQTEVGISARGYEKIGTYSSTDKRGLEYLSSRVTIHSIVSIFFFVAAAVALITAALSAIPTFGVGAGVFSVISAACATISGFAIGVMQSANNALAKANRYAQQGKTYSIYRNYILFGLVATGYDVE